MHICRIFWSSATPLSYGVLPPTLSSFVCYPFSSWGRARPRIIPPLAILPAQEPISEAPLVLEAMAEKTLREFSVPSTDNVATGPNINVGDVNFELKSSLINMVQGSPICGKPNEDANAHLQNFLELCDTVVIRGVAADVVKLRLFPFSLLGKAK